MATNFSFDVEVSVFVTANLGNKVAMIRRATKIGAALGTPDLLAAAAGKLAEAACLAATEESIGMIIGPLFYDPDADDRETRIDDMGIAED